ncbi:hypothetical protein HYQ46_008309 [Verticillium longisporum]|nr:hypothetical protein HYQ46_008309 [Verticillium longisporum]
MRFLHSLIPALALLCAGAAQAASSWGFDDATVSILRKPEAVKETLSSKGLLKTPITLGAKESIKIALTTKENGKAKRPHQAFLILRDTATGLEAPFPLNVKENGKGTVEIAQKDLPIQHSITPEHLGAYIVIGSFGSSAAVESPLFNLKIDRNPDDLRPLSYEAPLRYGKLNEQTHHYRKHDTSPNILLSLIGLGLVVATYPALLAAWGYFGANLNHAQQALSKAPVAHATFFGSIIAMEGVFVAYHIGWKLLHILPIVGVVGTVTFLSGVKALSEVQGRRLAGLRQ